MGCICTPHPPSSPEPGLSHLSPKPAIRNPLAYVKGGAEREGVLPGATQQSLPRKKAWLLTTEKGRDSVGVQGPLRLLGPGQGRGGQCGAVGSQTKPARRWIGWLRHGTGALDTGSNFSPAKGKMGLLPPSNKGKGDQGSSGCHSTEMKHSTIFHPPVRVSESSFSRDIARSPLPRATGGGKGLDPPVTNTWLLLLPGLPPEVTTVVPCISRTEIQEGPLVFTPSSQQATCLNNFFILTKVHHEG